jgi:hypothetical protein
VYCRDLDAPSAYARLYDYYPLPFEQDGKWGYVNTDGDIIIHAQWDYAEAVYDGSTAIAGNRSDGKTCDICCITGEASQDDTQMTLRLINDETGEIHETSVLRQDWDLRWCHKGCSVKYAEIDIGEYIAGKTSVSLELDLQTRFSYVFSPYSEDITISKKRGKFIISDRSGYPLCEIAMIAPGSKEELVNEIVTPENLHLRLYQRNNI